jgi:hypothetical protein
MPTPRPDPVGEFARLKKKYIEAGCARASSATNPGHLLDLVVRHKIFQNPRLSYAQAMSEARAADPELWDLYAL